MRRWYLYTKRTITPRTPIISMLPVMRCNLLLIKMYSFCSFHAMCRYFNPVQTLELQKFSELISCQREEAVTFYGCQTAAVILLSKGGSMYNTQQIYRSYESCSVLLKFPAKTTLVRNIMDYYTVP